MKLFTTAALLALVAAPALAEGWKDDYQVVKFGILSGENEKDRLMRNEPLRTYLENELGVKVEIFTAGNYDGVVQALAADQIEIARFGSSSYAAAYTATEGGVRPILTTVKKNGNTGYNSIVVTRCDSGIKNLDDAKGKVHAFADPDSTSGYAVPFFNMKEKLGIDPASYFSAIPFSGSHEAGVQGVVNGTFDTASTYQNNDVDGIPQRMVAKGMIEDGVVCTIWESPEITSGPWTVRNNLPEEMVNDIAVALENFAEKDPEGFKLVTSFDPTDENPDTDYIRVDHDRYQWIVDMRQWIKEQRRGS
ncbi:phosphate/phosphite/phosphonate ABC transporter substrate-binding protein [Salipiger sp. P9]|uniref:phosphate/phosphite/phosphonate ABC transporter substrate-binding protein n=1 Tax=Salipiger pentaromativorans TaxID=2943193 RepID=UPI0021572758|nr:phosphate/phosphite/phosphonate ABC transporter substrate-binding protein [Salipiger pentaromativorans]MCR8546947.1 phosphate/phosphite/phosphonate ABC transporter substrate-binding protein [Salipiger pentaromativorans]